MNIPKIMSLNVNRFLRNDEPVEKPEYTNRFGLRMASPLKHDTVTFGNAKDINKAMGSITDAINNNLALKLTKNVEKSHNNFVKLMFETFGDIMSSPEKKGLVTYKERIKSEFSVRQKTTSILNSDDEQVLKKLDDMQLFDFFKEEMKDISGNAFILETKKSFKEFITRFSKLVKSSKVNVVDMEYYRIPPISRRGKIVESFDSLNPNYIRSLGEDVDKVKNHTTPILDEKPSPAGYSGLHITVRHKDGTYTEIQVMTRAMWDLKEVENFFYKLKDGKTLDPKYSLIEKVLTGLKPLKNASDKAMKEYKTFKDKIKMYTKEAYKERLKHSFEADSPFLRPSDVNLGDEFKDYDFNEIEKLRQICLENAERLEREKKAAAKKKA